MVTDKMGLHNSKSRFGDSDSLVILGGSSIVVSRSEYLHIGKVIN